MKSGTTIIDEDGEPFETTSSRNVTTIYEAYKASRTSSRSVVRSMGAPIPGTKMRAER